MRKVKLNQISVWVAGIASLCCFWPSLGQASYWEASGTFSFTQTNYGTNSYQWSRRWGISFGYVFWDNLSEVEFAIQDNFYRNKINGYEDTSFHDQIYSANWVQNLTGKNATLQPYVKVGFGQLNRNASGAYASGATPPALYDSLTAILSVGLRVFITRTFAIKGEASTYLTGGLLSTWQDNVAVGAGISLYF